MRIKLKQVKEGLRQRMHRPIAEQGRWLGQVVARYFNYFAVPTNDPRAQRLPLPYPRPLATHA
jgi:RNA-directed DNA polymerase